MSRRISVVGRGVIGRDQRVVALKEAQGSCLFSQMREQRPKDGEGLARGLMVTESWKESEASPGSRSSNPTTLCYILGMSWAQNERYPTSSLKEPGPAGIGQQSGWGANGVGAMTCGWISRVSSPAPTAARGPI